MLTYLRVCSSKISTTLLQFDNSDFSIHLESYHFLARLNFLNFICFQLKLLT